MKHMSQVYKIMIASPGDTEKERLATEKIIYDWNIANHPTTNIVLLPIRYEINTPLGESVEDVQEIIDKYVTNTSDMVIGIFRTKLGRMYNDFLTYTLHEIKEHIGKNRLAMIFMYSGNYPRNTNPEDIQQLNVFKNNISKYISRNCLFREYKNLSHFRQTLTRELQLTVNTYFNTNSLDKRGYETDSLLTNHNYIQFFCQDNRPPETAFFHMINNTNKFYFVARTGITFMARYSIRMRQALDEGCHFRFLIVNPESKIIRYGRGDTFLDQKNATLSLAYLKDLKKYCPERVEIKLSEYYPTFDIEYFEYKNNNKFLLLQTHFIASHLGPDRPMFLLSESNPWYHIFWDEFVGMWNHKDNLIVD